MTRRRILAVTTSPLPYEGQITDGPGYRMWNLLGELTKRHDVRILSLYESFHMGQRNLGPVTAGSFVVERIHHSPGRVQTRVREMDPDLLYLPWSSTIFLGKSNRGIPTVIDYAGVGLLESLAAQGRIPLPLLELKLESFWYGDCFITTTMRGRYYLIGLLAASRRLSTGLYDHRDTLVRLVRMAPPAEPPMAETLRPSRRDEELIVLLAGAFLPWYDYRILASAIPMLDSDVRSRLRVVILGGNPRMPREETRVRRTFDDPRLRGTVEFTGIVPFAQRAEYYLGADVALSIAPTSVEDELSSRTRIVDYVWARLPILASGRDEYSAEILQAGGGVPFGPSPESLAYALQKVERDRALLAEAKQRMEALMVGAFNPSKAVEPLHQFIEKAYVTERQPRGLRGFQRIAMLLRDAMHAIRVGRT